MTTSTTFKPLVLITGANQGLGYAAAQNLASTNNYRLLIGSRSLAKAEDAIRQLRAEAANKIDGSTLVPVVLDVANDDSIAAAAKSISDKFGSLDILINNAGIATSPDTNVSLRDDYHAVFGTNVFGVAVIIDCFLPLLRASSYHDRRIVNVTSGLGQMGVAYSTVSHYSAKAFALPVYRSSKAALNMLTAVYAATLADENILVVSAAPGYCRTAFSPHGIKEASEGAKELVHAATQGNPKSLYGKIVGAELECEIGW